MTITSPTPRTEGATTGSTVRAALLTGTAAARFELGEITTSPLQAGEVLVQVEAVGLCHSDWTVASTDYGLPLPALLGHELAGVVLEVGDGVRGVAVGDHVVGCGLPACGQCQNCLEARPSFCTRQELTQRSEDSAPRLATTAGDAVWQMMGIGGFAERTVVHHSELVTVDPRVPFDRAALLGCAIATGGGTVIRTAKVGPRESVVVFGAGGVGLNVAQAARLVGARRIIVVDVQDDKLELARKFGATDVVNARETDPVEEVARITGGLGVEHVFEVTGLPGPLEQGYRMRAIDGNLHIVGMQKPGATFELPTWDVQAGGSVRAVFLGTTNPKVDIPYYADMYLQGRLNIDDLVGRRVRLEDIDEEYARVLSGGSVARSVVVFD
ncbi:zinc-binding dehydrogenase [Kineococcus sp. SYSU DK001]|uniref:zinc-binding dehydrogenase n=1 Tax=Kineococcus sp. SYSU DK001 TaxID=3383122 RepID=UPI003D7D22E6